jgi:hypothetical protein
VPYALLRLAKPSADPANGWFHEVITSPSQMFMRFWETFYLNIAGRFFSHDFFHFSTNADGVIIWIGKWAGLSSLFNPELAVLPWLMVFMLVCLIWKGNGNRRRVIGYLSLAIIGGFMFLILVITSYLSHLYHDVPEYHTQLIQFSGDIVGRYYYPLFTAWFLGLVSLSFPNYIAPPPEAKATE